MTKLVINFENEATAERFMSWLENQGQEDYWNYIKETEDLDGTEDEHSAVVNFEYDYDDWIIDTESGDIEIQTELNDFGDFEEDNEEGIQ
jgi:predicted acetyltransferase